LKTSRGLRLGITGFPLGHSLSPLLHTAALKASGLSGSYECFPIPPLPEGFSGLQNLIEKMREGAVDGLNVTIPHKQSILKWVDEASPTVQRVGAANLIYKKDDRILAENSDVPAFQKELIGLLNQSGALRRMDRKAVILGAGGAARAAAYALLLENWEIWVAARNSSQGETLAQDFKKWYPKGMMHTMSLHRDALALFDFPILIVNTTPVGMFPQVDQSPWPMDLDFPAGSVLFDLVYNPTETALIRKARSSFLPAINGCGLLVEQAAISFSLWTGRRLPVQAMHKALEQHLQAEL